MLNSVILLTIAVLLRFQLGSAKQRFVPNVPEECQRLGYCNLPQPDYPEEHIKSLIETLGLQNTNQSVINSVKPITNLDPREVDLCDYVEREFIPLVAQDSNGTWNFIINSKHYRQTYRVQICNKERDPCAPVAHFYAGYYASCEQNYIKKIMKAIDHKGNVIDKEHPIPSNCYCKVKDVRIYRNPEDVKSLHSKKLDKRYHKDSKGSNGRS